MAGTDQARGDVAALPAGAPAVILVEPQLGENIGMAARAMLNTGLTDLRMVQPRDGWPSEAAQKAASGADVVIGGARVFESTAAACADLQIVYATTARSRDMTKRVLDPRGAAAEFAQAARAGQRTGVLFGKESKGLTNDDVALAEAIVRAPLNPAFASLNLAQAVFLVGYEWRLVSLDAATGDGGSEDGAAGDLVMPKDTRLADHKELVGLYEHLEAELTACHFLYPPERAPVMARNLRNMFGRARLTEQEVRSLRGVVAALRRGPKSGLTPGPDGDGNNA